MVLSPTEVRETKKEWYVKLIRSWFVWKFATP